MAEAGVPESTMLALMGHMSRAMMERFSHIRLAAKQEAVAALPPLRGLRIQAPHPQKSPQSKTLPKFTMPKLLS